MPSRRPLAQAFGRQAENQHGNWNGVLARVIAKQHIRAVYQPMVRLRDGAVIGFEALARPANTPDDGNVTDLFGTAQKLGLVQDLEWLCWRAALAGAHELPPEIVLSVNVTETTLKDPRAAVTVLVDLLGAIDRPPSALVVDLVCPEASEDPAGFASMLVLCRQRGLRVAIANVVDDQPLFDSLAATSPDFIKLSRGLVDRLHEFTVRSFLESAVSVADQRGFTLVAEGIETEQSLVQFSALGVAVGQGFLLGRPGPLPSRYLPVGHNSADASGRSVNGGDS